MNRIFLALILVFLVSVNSVNAQNFSTHQVKEGETIEDIAKRYYIAQFYIYSLNPD